MASMEVPAVLKNSADSLAGARYNFTLCHASQTDAAPLVANEFNGRQGHPKYVRRML